jgi:hypothetical protein
MSTTDRPTRRADQPPWLASLPPVHARALQELWQEVVERGWHLDTCTVLQSWQIRGPWHAGGASFDPPEDMSTGVVSAYDNERCRTLRHTGVDDHLFAVALIRRFLDWPHPNFAGLRACAGQEVSA